jgi:hypothetical protein
MKYHKTDEGTSATRQRGQQEAGVRSQDVELEAVVLGSGPETRPDVSSGDGDGGIERMGGGEDFDHGR